MHGPLPDGSGFFIAEVGAPRPPGFIGWLKYAQNERGAWARGWLYLWRNYHLAYDGSRGALGGQYDGCDAQLSHWRSLSWAFDTLPNGWRFWA